MGAKTNQTPLTVLPFSRQMNESEPTFATGATLAIDIGSELLRIKKTYSITTVEEAAALAFLEQTDDEFELTEEEPVLRELAHDSLEYLKHQLNGDETIGR